MPPSLLCRLPLCVIALCWSLSASLTAATLSDARITEFMASNSAGLQDADGDRPDWIEVWNSSGVAGDLGGWFLTDDPANLTKWAIPAVQLGSGSYLIVFASAKDRTDPAAELHTNFRLQAAAGSYLALVKPDGTTIASEFAGYPAQLPDIAYGAGFQTAVPVTLVETGDTARWTIPSGPIGGWTAPGFDDSAWSSGATGIGYDNVGGSYSPFIGAGDDLRTAMRTVNPSAYIRVAFELPDPAGITDLVLSARWEDGFIAYLNGTEVHRERAPATPAWDSTSNPNSGRNETDAVTFFDYPLSGGNLVTGTNVLAIHGLNDSAGSSDFLFSPRLTATQQNVVNLVAGFFPEPTPGSENATRFDGITADTKFSTDRGLHSAPFDLAITTETEGATIRYTTNGTPPSETSGTIYSGPIRLSETTVIRAIAYKQGFRPTNIDTQTYIFPTDVVTQPAMRTQITQDPAYAPKMVDALTSIPTIALTFAGNDIDRTEIPVSVELLNFEGGAKQLDAGVVRYGSYVTNFAKRSIRLHFRSEYGPKRLSYPLFDGFDYNIPPVEDFDALDLRAGNHDMVARGAYLSNRFTDDSMIEMGQIAPHGRFVHLYFNGEYRGQYHLRERWDAAMFASYFPGNEAEYDTINANNTGSEFLTGELQDGDLTDWNEIRTLLNGATPYSSVKDKLDVADLIDFMLLWTAGQSESEFRAGGSVENGVGFKFLIKDADGYLRPPDGAHAVTHNGPLNAMTRFRTEGDPDFKILLADRIHKHFFNDGAMTGPKLVARLQRRVDETLLSFIAESARWGQHSGQTNHTPAQWLAYQNNLLNSQLPTRTDLQLAKFRAAGMYPDIIAPVLSQHGGSIPPGAGITMATGASAIYYTLDGSDPRLPGGAISPSAVLAPFDGDVAEPQDFIGTGDVWKYLDDGSDQGSAWRASAFDDSGWAEGPSELGYGESDEATDVDAVDVDPDTTGVQRNATTYFRHKVTIAAPASFSYFSLKMKYDDGAAVYVNGSEVVRTSNLPAGASFDTYANGSTPNENAYFEFTVPSARFVAGENTLAVEIHNASPTSSDISFDLRLRGEIDTSSGDNITQPVILSDPAQLNARAYNSATAEWSALTAAFFSINSTLATPQNLAISEIHYHPAEPSTPAELAISTDRDDYEFIELLNIGAQPIDLTGVHFSTGINFAFAANTILDPGDRAVLVRDAAAFSARYGPAVAVAGSFSGRLSNDGEQLVLSLTGSGELRNLTYNDQLPWPTLPDGGGFSLVLRSPETNPDHALAENWGSHSLIGGAPGQADTIQAGGYASWKVGFGISDDGDDGDGDGITALLEYALGTSPRRSSAGALPVPGTTTVGGERFLTIRYEKNPFASDILFQLQSSGDLAGWQDEEAIEVAPDTYRTATPLTPGARQYLRLQISLR